MIRPFPRYPCARLICAGDRMMRQALRQGIGQHWQFFIQGRYGGSAEIEKRCGEQETAQSAIATVWMSESLGGYGNALCTWQATSRKRTRRWTSHLVSRGN